MSVRVLLFIFLCSTAILAALGVIVMYLRDSGSVEPDEYEHLWEDEE